MMSDLLNLQRLRRRSRKMKRKLIYSYTNYHPFAVLICPHTYPFQGTLPFCIYLVGARFCKGVKVCLGHRAAPIYTMRGLCEIDFIKGGHSVFAQVGYVLLLY